VGGRTKKIVTFTSETKGEPGGRRDKRVSNRGGKRFRGEGSFEYNFTSTTKGREDAGFIRKNGTSDSWVGPKNMKA